MMTLKKRLMFLIGFCCISIAYATKDLQKMVLVSTAFQDGEYIPMEYTCDGQDMSPPLSWSGFPEHTKSFVLVCVDPDAPHEEWVHWIVYNISAQITHFLEDEDVQKKGARFGITSWGEAKKGYGGPCPPSGAHRYIFTLYALDVEQIDSLVSNPNKHAILDAIKNHTLAIAQLVGRYHKKD